MSKTSAAVKNRYASKAYDSLRIIVPKGRKGTVEARVSENGETVNGYVNRLIREDLGISDAEWKRPADDDMLVAGPVLSPSDGPDGEGE